VLATGSNGTTDGFRSRALSVVERAQVLELKLGIALPCEPAGRRWALGSSRASAAGEESRAAGVSEDDRHRGGRVVDSEDGPEIRVEVKLGGQARMSSD